jgi:hypothetical protein
MKKDRTSLNFVLIIIGIYIILATAIMVLTYRWTTGVSGKVEDFTKTAAIWVTLLTSLLTAVISVYVLYRQKDASTELESLKSQLATNLEFLKSRFSAERKAYDELFSAAVIYYHTLARLEIGTWDRAHARKAEDGMLTACRYIIAIENEHKDIWYQIWQQSRALSEIARDLKDKDSRRELWRDNVKEYGKLLMAFQEAASAKHESYGNAKVDDV